MWQIARWRLCQLVESGKGFRGGGLVRRETYGEAALLFGAADFEIGQTRYAGVFLEFCIEVLR